MKHSVNITRRVVTLVVVAALLACSLQPAAAMSPVKLNHWSGTVNLWNAGITPFELAGTASHLGQFLASGEVEFLPIGENGSLVGAGPVVFTAANGDLLVGVVTWDVGPEAEGERATRLHFSWRDAVTFSDGTLVASSGRFVSSRPPGLVVIAIIGILIGLLLPAVQK
jgi:hypothetical protein